MTSPCVIVFIPEEVSNHLHSVAPPEGIVHTHRKGVFHARTRSLKTRATAAIAASVLSVTGVVLRTQMCRCKIMAELLHRLR